MPMLKSTLFRTVVFSAVAVLLAVFVLFTGVMPVLAADPYYDVCTESPSNPVFDPTERAYYPCIIFDGASYHLWYDDGSSTSYSTSADGISWSAGTVLTGLTNALHAVVVNTGTKYLIWYWDSNMTYSINDLRTAESTDGINWTNDASITQVGSTVITGVWPGWNRGSYGPCEVFYNAGGSATIVAPVDAVTVWQNKFVMYYDGTDGGTEDIGVAVSADGKLWEGLNGGLAPVLAHSGGTAWDSDFTTFCAVQKIGGIYHMWYSGGKLASNEGIGYAQSADGLTWTKDADNPMLHMTDGITWRSGRTYTPEVLYNPAWASPVKMWYTGVSSGNYVLGYAAITALPPTTTPATVGGRVEHPDKLALLYPWLFIGLGLVIVSALSIRRSSRRN
jgi:hypothetical protein